LKKLLTPAAVLEYTGLDMAESTLATARTTGFIGKQPAPMFVTVASKPYYRRVDVDAWLEQLPAHSSNAEHEAA